MRTTQWIISLFLATYLCTAAAATSDAAPAAVQTPAKEATLEKINGAPAATEHNMKDCPMMQGKKECMHKDGEPCPNEHNAKHKAKAAEKCDYMKKG